MYSRARSFVTALVTREKFVRSIKYRTFVTARLIMRMRVSAKDVFGHVCYYEQLDSLTIYLPFEISTNQPILQCIRVGVGKLHTGRVSYIFRSRVGKGRRRVISLTHHASCLLDGRSVPDTYTS